MAIARLRRDCVLAKEALSADTETLVPVTLPGVTTSVRLTRTEFEQMVAPTLTDTIRRRASSPRLRGPRAPTTSPPFVLVGGSSRIPLVSERLVAEFGRPVAIDTHPKHEIALGAAIATLPSVEPALAGVPVATTSTLEDTQPVAPVGGDDAATTEVLPPHTEPAARAAATTSETTSAATGARTGAAELLRRRGVLVGAAVAVVAVLAVTGAMALGGDRGDATGGNGSKPPATTSGGSSSASSPSSPATDLGPIAPGTWDSDEAATLEQGLDRVTAVPFDHQLVVVAGDLPSGVGTDKQQIYDPDTQQWTTAAMPDQAQGASPLDHAAAAASDSHIYLVGGRTTWPTGKKQVRTEVWQEAGPTGEWQSLPPLPQPRAGGAAVWDGKRLLYAGGQDQSGKVHPEIWAWAPGGAWHPVGKLTVPRSSMAVATDGKGTAWFMGGASTGAKTLYRNVDVVKGSKVTAGAALPAALALGAAAYLGDLGPCYIGGFKNPTGGFAAAAVKDLACREAKRPNPLPSMPSVRFGTSAGGPGRRAVRGQRYRPRPASRRLTPGDRARAARGHLRAGIPCPSGRPGQTRPGRAFVPRWTGWTSDLPGERSCVSTSTTSDTTRRGRRRTGSRMRSTPGWPMRPPAADETRWTLAA